MAANYSWKLAFGLQNLVCGQSFNFLVTISLIPILMGAEGTPFHRFSAKSGLPTGRWSTCCIKYTLLLALLC